LTNSIAQVRSVYYGWWLAIIAGFIMIITSVPIFHAMTVWAVVMEAHFGWSRVQLGFALSLTRVEGSISGPIAGYLTDKFGARIMVLTGLLILAAGFFLFSQVQNLWMFYLAFFIMSLGNGQGGWLPMMTLMNNWFSRRRSTAMAITMTGMGLGALVLVPAIAWAVDPDQDRLGWRLTAGILGGVVLASAVILPKFIRNKPQDYGLLPDGDRPGVARRSTAQVGSNRTGRETVEIEFTTSQALKTPAFWFISFGHGFGSMVVLGIFAHLGLLMVEDLGFSVQQAAWIFSVYTAVAMVFQMLGGFLGDRIPKNVALFIFTAIQASAVIILATATSLFDLYLFAIIFGVGFGGRNPLTTAIRGEYFGRASFGKILGISTVPMNILLLISSPLAGYMRDVQGSYEGAFITLAILNFIGAGLFLLCKKPKPPTPTKQPQAAS